MIFSNTIDLMQARIPPEFSIAGPSGRRNTIVIQSGRVPESLLILGDTFLFLRL
jgi:hypothetical protein